MVFRVAILAWSLNESPHAFGFRRGCFFVLSEKIHANWITSLFQGIVIISIFIIETVVSQAHTSTML